MDTINMVMVNRKLLRRGWNVYCFLSCCVVDYRRKNTISSKLVRFIVEELKNFGFTHKSGLIMPVFSLPSRYRIGSSGF